MASVIRNWTTDWFLRMGIPGLFLGASLFTGMAADPVTASKGIPVQSTPRKQSLAKYEKPTPQEILFNRTLAFELAEQTRWTIVPTMHPMETDHFLIFSAWNRMNDAALANLCERMYQKLSEQFSIPATESVWAGKCPIYLFWEPAHYARFISEIDNSKATDANMAHANGYHASRGWFSYVVINGVSSFGLTEEQAKAKFYHVLVHEGTHAFLHRYISERSMPLWVEEGLADYIAASLVPEAEVNRTYLTATRSALHRPEMVQKVLEKKEDLTPAEYGIAQSLIRFLVMQDRTAMIRFIQLMKEGKSESTALATAYHGTTRDLVQLWGVFWQRALGPVKASR
jgi:hypothetical protein